jgi:uncharacterized membrane protein YccC
MAQNRQTSSLRGALARLGSPPPEAAFATRFAVCVSAAVWLGHVSGLVTNQSQWILISVLMVAQPNTGGSLQKGLLRAVGTAIAAVTAIAVFGLAAQDPALLMASLFLVQVVGAYGFSGSRNQYAFFVFAFTTAIILGDALSGTDAIETVAFQRATMVGLGVLIVVVADALLWPERTEVGVRSGLAARARALGAELREALTSPAPTAAPTLPASQLASQLGGIEAARSEVGVSASRAAILRHLAILLEAVASRRRILGQPLENSGAPVDPSESLARARETLATEVEAALEEIAAALLDEREPAPFADRLEAAFLPLQAELARRRAEGMTRDSVEGRVANLRDLVALLGTLEHAFEGLTHPVAEGKGLSLARLARWRPDPFRTQIALRAGVAVCVAFLIPMTLGWSVNTMVGPFAFMVAAIPTRGGVKQTLWALLVAVGLGWLLADLSVVFVGTELQRLPLALLHVAAIAGALGYASVKRPQLVTLRTIAGVVALLPVYAGAAAPTDVYGPYNTVCYMTLALAIGWATTHLLWPATAATLFRERAAAQLELCLAALRDLLPSVDAVERRQHAAELLQRNAGQLAQVGTLHGQAQHEPVERGLDGARRAALLAATQDLFDASLAFPGGPAFEPGDGPPTPALASLREALRREHEALLASVRAAADALRGAVAPPGASLTMARRAVFDRLDELRQAEASAAPDPSAERTSLIEQLDALRQIVTRQLALEAWLADWAAAGNDLPYETPDAEAVAAI